jgi:hypothetical protein
MTARRLFTGARREPAALALAALIAMPAAMGAAPAYAERSAAYAGSIAAHGVPGLPPYPGATAVEVAGAIVLTTRDPQSVARVRYEAIMRKAGWLPAYPEGVLNGALAGAGASAALKEAGTLLSFVRDSRTADIWISSGVDRHRKPVTMLMLMSEQRPRSGGAHGRPAR